MIKRLGGERAGSGGVSSRRLVEDALMCVSPPAIAFHTLPTYEVRSRELCLSVPPASCWHVLHMSHTEKEKQNLKKVTYIIGIPQLSLLSRT